MTLSIVATAFPLDTPPRIALSVTSTTSAPNAVPAGSPIVVQRTDPDGVARTIILEVNPHLTTGAWTGYDYHAPFGQNVTYTVTAAGSQATTSAVNLPVTSSWLLHRTNPALSFAVPGVVDISDGVTASTSAAHWVFGASKPVVYSEGVRRSESGTVTIRIDSKAQRSALDSLFADDGIVLVNFAHPDSTVWWDLQWAWIQPGDITRNNPAGSYMQYRSRHYSFPYQVVNTPSGAIVPQWTWANVVATYATWADVQTTYASWSDLVTDTRSG